LRKLAQITIQFEVELPHINAIAACGLTSGILRDMIVRQTKPVLVIQQMV